MRAKIEMPGGGWGRFGRITGGRQWRRDRAVGAAVTAAAVAVAGSAGRAGGAVYTLSQSDAGGTSSYNTSLNFKNNSVAAAPSAGNTYNTGAFTLRSPGAATAQAFAGDSLSIDAGGRFLGKVAANATQTLTINNLILNGGLFDQASSANDNAVLAVNGAVTVAAPSLVGTLAGETLTFGATLNGTAGLTVGGPAANGGADVGTVVLAGSVANYSGTFNVASGTLAFNQSGAVTIANPILGGGNLSQQGTGTLTLTGGGTIGTLQARAGAVTLGANLTGTSFTSIGLAPGDVGVLNVPAGTTFSNVGFALNVADQGGATTASNGTVNLTGGTINTGTLFVGKGGSATAAAAVGTVNQTAGTLTASTGLQVGVFGTGTYALTGGTATLGGGFLSLGLNAGSTGTMTVASGGTFNNNATRDLNIGDSGTGVLNINAGGTFNAANGTFYVARQTVSTGTVNLNAGGTLIVPAVLQGNGGTPAAGGNSTFNFNGGTLRAPAASGNFIGNLRAVNVLTGGAVIDTNGFAVTVGRGLVTGVTGSADGGLTKAGAGTLSLTAASTYTGTTTVTAGELRVNNPTGSGTGTGGVVVNAGATLGGAGTVANAAGSPVVVGGTITAGADATANGIGLFTTGAEQWNGGGGGLFAKVAADGLSNDVVSMSGLVLAATSTDPFLVAVASFGTPTLAGSDAYVLAVDTEAAAANPFAPGANTTATLAALRLTGVTGVQSAAGGFALSTRSFGTTGYSLVLTTATAVPEPSALLALAGVASLALGRRRR